MPECDLGFVHPDSEPTVIPVPVPVDNGPNENDVKIAEIEADASIEREKIWTEQQAIALEADRDALRGELRGMREVLDRLVPPAPDPSDTPAPVILPPAEPTGPVGEPAAPPDVEHKSKKDDGGYWAGYDQS